MGKLRQRLQFLLGVILGLVVGTCYCTKAKAHDDSNLRTCLTKCEMSYDSCVRHEDVNACRGADATCKSECNTWDMNH